MNMEARSNNTKTEIVTFHVWHELCDKILYISS